MFRLPPRQRCRGLTTLHTLDSRIELGRDANAAIEARIAGGRLEHGGSRPDVALVIGGLLMFYVLTQLLAVGARWEMAGIGAAIAAAVFSSVGMVKSVRRFVFPPHVEFISWITDQPGLPEYRNWHHASFCNRQSHWGTTEAERCEAAAEIEYRDGSTPNREERLIVARLRPVETWAMRRGQFDKIPLLLENDEPRVLGFDQDMRRAIQTDAGTYVTDWHFIFGMSGREPLDPGDYRMRVRLEYDGHKAFSPWLSVTVPQ